MEITQTVKTGSKIHALVGIETFKNYGELAVTACNNTVPVKDIGHDEITCGNCQKVLAAK